MAGVGLQLALWHGDGLSVHASSSSLFQVYYGPWFLGRLSAILNMSYEIGCALNSLQSFKYVFHACAAPFLEGSEFSC